MADINASVSEQLMALDGFGTEWSANTTQDGTGADVTGTYSVTAEPFASTVKLTITNNGGGVTWLREVHVRGRGIYDPGPFTVEAVSGDGVKPLQVDQPYQDDPNVSDDIAQFILNQYETQEGRVDTLSIWPEKSAAFMALAMGLEPDDLVAVTEDATGLRDASLSVHQVRIGVVNGRWLTLELGVAPNVVGAHPWILGDATYSVLDSTTILSFV